jgi:hypothetical protein
MAKLLGHEIVSHEELDAYKQQTDLKMELLAAQVNGRADELALALEKTVKTNKTLVQVTALLSAVTLALVVHISGLL